MNIMSIFHGLVCRRASSVARGELKNIWHKMCFFTLWSCCASLVAVFIVVAIVVVVAVVLDSPPSPRGKVIAPLHHRGVAEPELLVHDVGGVRARAGNISPRHPRHCPYHGRRRRRRRPEMGGVPPTIARYSSVVLLLLIVVVLAPHRLEPTPPSVLVAVIIGAPPGATQHDEDISGSIHREPLLVGGGGASRLTAAAASTVVALLPRPNIPPNLHPGNGNALPRERRVTVR